MADAHNGVHISSGVEISLELHPDRITGLDQIVKNAVGDFLMGDRAISIAVHVELDGFQLNNPRSRLIKKSQHSEIGITGERAEAGELRKLDGDFIRPAGARVVKTDQLGISDGPLAIEGRAGGFRG